MSLGLLGADATGSLDAMPGWKVMGLQEVDMGIV